MDEYERRRAEFSWEAYRDACDWDPSARLNLAHEVVDRHADAGDALALHWLGDDGRSRSFTYAELARDSNRFANVLDDLGVGRGDRLFTYMPRVPEHYTVLLGTLKTGAVFGAINERYGVDGVGHRLRDSRAKVVVTTAENAAVVSEATADAGSVEHVVFVGGGDREVDYAERMAGASERYETAPTGPDDPALLYYTSGTTGPSKGVVHGHRLVLNLAAMADAPLGLRSGDLFWCTADLGWLTGLIPLGGLFHGVPALVYGGEFDPGAWASVLDEWPVTVLFSVPTAFRMLKERDDLFAGAELTLRTVLSVGEPLNPGVVEWSRERFGSPVLDNYGTSEAFGGVLTNFPFDSWAVRPGSMGRPNLGVDVRLVDPESGSAVAAGEVGEVAVADYPGRFLHYWEREPETESAIRDGLLFTGDLARRDEDGYFWFEGRADDVIISSGYRIGPFDVESTLVDHEAVAEAAVVPAPDERRGSVVKAFVVLSAGAEPSEALRDDVRTFVRERLSAHEYPREIEFVDDLPKTVTGKIRRRELRE